jgi:hypothetical protein
VPLALARQRLLTATFPYYQLKDEPRGPAGGFVYTRKQNNKGEEVGGIVPHVTLKSLANNEPSEEEVLVDRPEVDRKVTRVTGPCTVEATIPTPVDWEGDGIEDSGAVTLEEHGSFVDRMPEVLRKSPVLHLSEGKTVTLKNIRPPAKTLSLSAEAVVTNPHPSPLPDGEGDQAVALVFGRKTVPPAKSSSTRPPVKPTPRAMHTSTSSVLLSSPMREGSSKTLTLPWVFPPPMSRRRPTS